MNRSEYVAIGMSATYCIGGDRYPYEVTAATPTGKTIWLRRIFTTDKGILTQKATLRKDGYYRFVGTNVGMITLGKAESYQSPEF